MLLRSDCLRHNRSRQSLLVAAVVVRCLVVFGEHREAGKDVAE